MCKKVDELAAQYNSDRYNANKSINLSMPSSTPDPTNLPSSVPEELFAIWLFQEELTPDEEERYDGFLRQQTRPPLVKSPPLQQPRVNWNRLNPGQYKNNLVHEIRIFLRSFLDNLKSIIRSNR